MTLNWSLAMCTCCSIGRGPTEAAQMEQWINIKFSVKLWKTSQEIHEMLRTVYENKTALFKWIQHFSEAHENLKDETRPWWLPISCVEDNIECVISLSCAFWSSVIWMIVDQLNLEKSSMHTILREHFQLRKSCAKIIPKLLIPDQMLRRTECYTDWKNSIQTFSFLERIITGDESW